MNDEIYNGQLGNDHSYMHSVESFAPEETAAFVTSAVVLLPVFASASMPIGRSDVDLAQLQLEFDHSSTSISHTTYTTYIHTHTSTDIAKQTHLRTTIMRPTALNLAKSVSKRPLRLKKASAELLPPIPQVDPG